MIGDIVIIPSTPPHLASVINDSQAICEDGVIRTYPADAAVAVTALTMLQELEKGVVEYHDAR